MLAAEVSRLDHPLLSGAQTKSAVPSFPHARLLRTTQQLFKAARSFDNPVLPSQISTFRPRDALPSLPREIAHHPSTPHPSALYLVPEGELTP